MTTAFCPGHITCFFQPVRTKDVLTTGSRGVGIRTSKGTTVTLEERSDDRLVITMDGKDADCPVTGSAVRMVSGRGYDITIDNDLPVGYGFGMSASGSIAAALCAARFEDASIQKAFESAHVAEVMNGGGLGDVSAIMCPSHVPVRKVAGLPPYGEVVDSGISFDRLYLKVLGGPLNTGCTLSNHDTSDKIARFGSKAVDTFLEKPSAESLFNLSVGFSGSVGLETPQIIAEIQKLPRAGMCMLGHSVFTDHEADGYIECSSTDRMPFICRE